MPSPADRYYTRDHEWLRLCGDDEAEIGITDHAQEQLGDIVFLELPAPGTAVTQHSPIGVIESVKAAADLYAPVSGTIVERNERLADAPELVNESPFDRGWMVRVRLADRAELDQLSDAATYDREFEEAE